MQISTLVEAAAELTALTGSPWSVSRVLDYCSQKLIPLSAKISIQDEDVESLARQQPTESLWQSARGFSTYVTVKPEALWLLRQDGIAKIKHPTDGPRSWPVREIPVTLERVWVKADALQKMYATWQRETQPQAEVQAKTASAAPVVTVGSSGGVELEKAAPKKDEPLPLGTNDIAFCFAGFRWNEQQWKKPLADKRKWLAAGIAIAGVRGVSQTRWNPVLIGAALVREGHAKQNSIRARFQTKPQLQPWFDAWKTYEADHFSTELNTVITPGVNPG